MLRAEIISFTFTITASAIGGWDPPTSSMRLGTSFKSSFVFSMTRID